MTNTIKPVPDGYTTVTPWMISAKDDLEGTAGLIDFLKRAFGAEELARVENPNGKGIGHAEVRIGDAVVMMFDMLSPDWPYTPAFLRLYLPDGDAAYQRAVDAGATPLHRMTEMFWGDRVGRVRDPFGNVYWIQTRVAELEPEEAERRMMQPEFVAAMEYMQSGEPAPPTGSAARISTAQLPAERTGEPAEYARYEAGPPAHSAETWIRRYPHSTSGRGR